MNKYTRKQIKEAIRFWKRQLISESLIPFDEKTLRDHFHDNESNNEKYAPTVDFLRSAYNLMNRDLFRNALPQTLQFDLSSNIRQRAIGLATYIINRFSGRITASKITLNSTRTVSLHEWLEIVLHEMIHIYDYTNNKEHFLIEKAPSQFQRNFSYDPHGQWFLNFGSQFDKYGFHVKEYCDADIGINVDNSRVKRHLSNSYFLELVGIQGVNGIIRVTSSSVNRTIVFMKARRHCCKSMNLLKSNNPNIIKLKETRMRDPHSAFSFYTFNDNFKNKYGPFELVKEISMNNSTINEDKDEMDIDDMNILDDEYARQMYNSVNGIVDIQKKGNNNYEISIA